MLEYSFYEDFEIQNVHAARNIIHQNTSITYCCKMSSSDFSNRFEVKLLLASQCYYIWPNYNDVIMNLMAYRIISIAIVYSNVYSGADQRKHQSSASLAFVRRIHRGPVISSHKWPVTRKIFPFDDVIMPNHFLGSLPIVFACFGPTCKVENEIILCIHYEENTGFRLI